MKHLSHLWVGLVLLPPVLYFIFFSIYAINLPIGDDLIVILRFLIEWDWADTATRKWHLLSQNFIEHRLVFTRLSALLTRWLSGELNFRLVMLVGNVCLLGILWLFSRPIVRTRTDWWYVLPVSLLLFQPIAYEGNFWAIASTNYMPVCFFGFLTFFLLSRQRIRWDGAAALAAAAATLTFANGLLIWPLGSLILLLQRRVRSLVGWSLLAALAFYLYYVGFDYVNRPDMVHKLVYLFPDVMANLLLLFGAFANPMDRSHALSSFDYIPMLFGALLFGWILYGLFVLIWQTPLLNGRRAVANPQWTYFLIGSGLFLLLSCCAFAAGRTLENVVVSESRYRNFPVFLLVLGYALAFHLSTDSWRPVVGRTALIGTLLFWLSSYLVYTPRLESMQRHRKAGVYNWTHNRSWAIYGDGGYFNRASMHLSNWAERYAANWYAFPSYLTIPAASAKTKLCESRAVSATLNVTPGLDVLHIEYPECTEMNGEPYGMLQSGRSVWLFGITKKTSLRRLLTNGEFETRYLIGDLILNTKSVDDLPAGKYRVGVALLKNDSLVAGTLVPNFTMQVASR
ncbi:hypothetical protein BN8_06621 [Fibrisoma limi BUZ 3]|uniref:Glycosyltransferase RgtA/B/C/D-like domain-containing protein n=1 Tax=Fibrisoma limi BUZ 3 TaxID=1185876 RepID=I2GTI6_9BACT|nr:hypothetical protein [Fibrisoma limi]CCH57215.1 hypothetical protein BN8_06621 [Fibrisoma limi BUZ 3]